MGWLYSRLLFACERGHLNAIKQCDLETLQQKFPNWYLLEHLLLHVAISGDLPTVRYLRKVGVRAVRIPRLLNDKHLNALECAALAGHAEIVTWFLDNGYHVGNPYKNPDSFISLVQGAINDGNLQVMESLLLIGKTRHGVQGESMIFASRSRLEAMLLIAVESSQGSVVEMMLKHGLSPNFVDERGHFPLSSAACLGDLQRVSFSWLTEQMLKLMGLRPHTPRTTSKLIEIDPKQVVFV